MDRARAVVRIEAPAQGGSKSVGAGFIVKGNGERHHVLTSTHIVLPDAGGQALPSGCVPLLRNTERREGNKGGSELVGSCVHYLGRNVSLIEFEPRDVPYPTLPLAPRDIRTGEWLFLAGYPFGSRRDTTRFGQVTNTDGPADTVVTTILTATGMSGGPHLTEGGSVVGLHQGGGPYTAGFAHMVPVWQILNGLKDVLGEVVAPPEPPNVTGPRFS